MRPKADIERDIAALEVPLAALKKELSEWVMGDQIVCALRRLADALETGHAQITDRERPRWEDVSEVVDISSTSNAVLIRQCRLELR